MFNIFKKTQYLGYVKYDVINEKQQPIDIEEFHLYIKGNKRFYTFKGDEYNREKAARKFGINVWVNCGELPKLFTPVEENILYKIKDHLDDPFIKEAYDELCMRMKLRT